MNKKDKIKLDVISGIDDEIIDHVTKKRFKLSRYLQKRPIWMKKSFYISAVAALLVLGMGLFLAVQLYGKQVPIYRGMTVSSDASRASRLSMDEVEFRNLMMTGKGYVPSHLPHEHERPDPNQNDPFGKGENGEDLEEAVKDSLTVERAAAEMYYADSNEDIYITIHIDNPDNFEILSFTLNGKKYSSYMFEDGSDMENLILKVNVGAVTGVVEYTIDAIKYVDGTAIKDVRMEGDRTVRVGVYTANQPTASVFNEVVGFDKLAFEVALTDREQLIALSEGKTLAVLYDGEELIASQEIALTEKTSVLFEGLKTNTLYQYAIVATYDALDGTGYNTYVLFKKALYTQEILSYDAVEIAQESISFHLLWNAGFADKTLVSFALYQGEEKLEDVAATATGIDGLLSDTDYTLVATYLNRGELESVVLDFHTVAKAVPAIQLATSTVTQTGFAFVLTETDVDNVGEVTKIELLHGTDAPIVAESLDVRAYEDLLSGNAYTVRVTYVYDLNDGRGTQMLIHDLDVSTKAKAAPVIKLNNLAVTEYTIAFDVHVTDPDAICELLGVELSLDGTVLATGTVFQDLLYEALAPNANHTVTVRYAYDAHDGRGRIETQFTQTVKTVSVVTIEGITYQLHDDKTATVIAADENIVEPVFVCVDGYTITEIGESAFENHTKLARVTIPATVKTIRARAFMNCTKLKTVTFSEGLEKICELAFNQCYALEAAHLPSTLTMIERCAFYYCEKLSSVTLPDGLKTVGDNAFDVCWRLDEIIIPASVTRVGTSAFGCRIVYTMHPEKPSGWRNDWNASSSSPVWNFKEFYTDAQGIQYALCNDGTAVVIGYTEDVATDVVLQLDGYTVTTIKSSAFTGCQKIKILIIPETVTMIESSSLEFGSSITQLYLETDEPSDEWGEYWNDKYLSTVWSFKEFYTDAQGVRYALLNDNTAVVIGHTENVFETVVLKLDGYTVTRIFPHALTGCGAKTVVIPASVTAIGNHAFELNANIYAEISEQPDGWEEEWNGWNRPVIWNFKEFYTDAQGVTYALLKDNTAIVIGFDDSTAEVVIGVEGYTVTEIQEAVFAYSKKLTSIVLPEGVISIAKHTFQNCGKLTNVVLPSTLTAIGESTFADCKQLTSICIPSGVLSIGNGAFWGCEKLIEVILSEGLQTICNNAFTNCTALPYVVIPASVTEIEPDAFPLYWGLKIYAKVAEEPRGWQANWISDTDGVVWNFKEFYIDTQGIRYVILNDNTAIVSGYTDAAGDIVIGLDDYNVTRIQAYALYNCNTVESIKIPKSVTDIGRNAFDFCWSLTEIHFDGTVEEWNAVEKEDDWNIGTPGNLVIICSDGNVWP